MWSWLTQKVFDWWHLFYSNTEQYILHGDEIYAVLNRLVNHKKKLFLITNSPFSFVWVALLRVHGSPHHSECRVVCRASVWKLCARGFCGHSHKSVCWAVAVESVAPHSSLYLISCHFLKKIRGCGCPHLIDSLFEEDMRLWLSIAVQSCRFGLPLLAFAHHRLCWTSSGTGERVGQLERAKGLHQHSGQWDTFGAFTNLCIPLCYWNESKFRTNCC